MTLLMVLCQPLFGQWNTLYISPGMQIGHTWGIGNFASAQVTVGFYRNDRSSRETDFIPGIAFGVRNHKNSRTLYVDAQIARDGAVGGGIGGAFIYTKSDEGTYQLSKKGIRVKAWGGFLVLATWDLVIVPNQIEAVTIGLMGVIPIPAGSNALDYLISSMLN